VWDQIRELIQASEPKTIESITNALQALGAIFTQNHYDAAQSAKDLVFSVLGWQTMLYKPDFVTDSMAGYRILNEMDGYRGETRLCLSQSALAGNKTLPNFLLGFGIMLPPPNYSAFDDADDKTVFREFKTVSPREMNAYVLAKICCMRFQWVDSLPCHLEMDKHSGTLFLYRYPSFCVSNLQQHMSKNKKQNQKCILHCCAFDRRSSVPWADEEAVTGLLQEVLLSYRLLFGQTKRSRSLFQNLRPFARIPPEGQDQLLSQLCSRKRPYCSITLTERDEYDLADDFPHLRSKLARLSSYASGKKPRSLRQLWVDKRNSPAWLAFWSVLIFGSVGILLAFIQTVFQILEYVDAVKHG